MAPLTRIEKEYHALAQEDPVASDDEYLREEVRKTSRNQCIRITIYLVIEALVFISVFFIYERYQAIPRDKPSFTERYFRLQDYNQTVHFTENVELMRKSSNSTKFWMDLQATSGIVSVPTEWALGLGFSPSRQSPETPGHSIYQLDMYHSLHCLYHIRNRLMSKLPLDVWPRDDVHSLHCVDFLRQQILCHGDTTLQGTDDFLHFAKNPGHLCRDTQAIRTWVEERNWAGHGKWIEDKYGVV
ncbi:hypothetical protein PFICI_00309 [Pestalotiopsis fici W106-1]|uniref:Tat pathway signal sequence n=1 Tax=Pestalotiopsis fici (strain W106-1 / CGMCC3.15140) TaxID=1229662 RepID=W3XMH0_PESFW|nr:uncharacterized protein PFICI_00309 [Pestalotiopsis fici W106-1]ETS86481.1 hypothetical protein PFICI_00309 [Pestalotiopsis fici W106-1]